MIGKKILDFLVGLEKSEEKYPPTRKDNKPQTPKEEPKPSYPPPLQPPKIITPEEEPQLENKTPYVKMILKELFIPYRNYFDTQVATEGFLLLVEFLDQEGDCPSVVQKSKERGEKLLNKLGPSFHKVSLKEHSLNVAKEIVRLLKENILDFEFLIPMGVIVALGHDLGKIPSVRDQYLYLKADHPILSAVKLGEIFSKIKAPRWLEKAKESIKGHHRQSPDEIIANLLRKADGRTRENEILQYNRNLRPKPLKGWPDPKKILKLICPEIDKIQLNNKFAAFSWGSVIFVQPDAFYEAAKRLALEEQIVSWDLLFESEKKKIQMEIVNALKKERMLAQDIPEGYYGRVCQIEYPNRTVSMILVPIKIEAFDELPSRILKTFKHGYLANIRSVKIRPLKNQI